MKIKFLILVSLIQINNCFSQWSFVQSNFGGNFDTLFGPSLYFANSEIGYCLGGVKSNGNLRNFEGLYKTVDNGKTFNLLLVNNLLSGGLTGIDGFGKDTIFVSLSNRRVVRSMNGGQSWDTLLNVSAVPYCLNDGSLFLYGEDGIYYSHDKGQSIVKRTTYWQPYLFLKLFNAAQAMVYNSSDKKIYISVDSCKSWTHSGELADPSNEKNLVFQFVNKNIIIAILGSKIYRSIDGGQRWSIMKDFVQNFRTSSSDGMFVISPKDILAIHHGDLYKSNDTGITWCLQSASPTGSFSYSNISPFFTISFVNDSTGYWPNVSVIGTRLLVTTNQGGPPCPSDTTIKGLRAELGFNQLKVFPNPSAGLLTLALEQGQMSQVQLFSMEGRLVFSQKLSEQEVTLQLPSISPGIYMLEVQSTANKVFRQKLVIE